MEQTNIFFLAKQLAKRYKYDNLPPSLSIDDLISIGTIAVLEKALGQKHGYIMKVCLGAMQDAILKESKMQNKLYQWCSDLNEEMRFRKNAPMAE